MVISPMEIDGMIEYDANPFESLNVATDLTHLNFLTPVATEHPHLSGVGNISSQAAPGEVRNSAQLSAVTIQARGKNHDTMMTT